MKAGWKQVRLGEIFEFSKNTEAPQAGQPYRLLGVRLWGIGAYERETIDGSETQYKQFTKIALNDIVVNKIWARNGAIAVVTNESLTGCYASSEFPVFQIVSDEVNPKWVHYATCQPSFWKQCDEQAFGTSGKNRIKPEKFLQVTIPLPPLAEQQRIVARLDAVKANLTEVERLRAQQAKDVKALLFAHYTRLVENAQWLPMREVAPIVRRPVAIDPDQNYPELGIRSFGKGTFHKPPVNGFDVGTKKLFQIKANDLMFSNVFAWEGAIAVATPDDDGRVGSHRFISCVADPDKTLPDFLCYHLLTPKGMEAIIAASPGGAGRNKTLGLEKLERILVPIPTLLAQGEFLRMRATLNQMQALHTQSAGWLGQLMPSLLAGAFGGGE